MTNILRISEAASLGLHAMMILAANNDEIVSLQFITEKLEVSANHLSKVMQRLVKAGLISSLKGKNGGFKLKQDPEEITLMDVYEAIDGKFTPSGCLLGRNRCEPHQCIMGDLVSSINNQVKEYFSNKKLKDFV